MKYIILCLLFVPFLVKAETPSDAFFFADGKGYDLSGTQTYFCFGDGSCYTLSGNFAFNRVPVQSATPVIAPVVTPVSPAPTSPVTLKPAYKSWAELLNATGMSYNVNQGVGVATVTITGNSNPFSYSLTVSGQSVRGSQFNTYLNQSSDVIFSYFESGREDTVLHINLIGQ